MQTKKSAPECAVPPCPVEPGSGGVQHTSGSAEVAGMPQGVSTRLRPHGQAVRLLADRDFAHRAAGGVEAVDDVVVAAREPEVLAVGGDVAHVRGAAAG